MIEEQWNVSQCWGIGLRVCYQVLLVLTCTNPELARLYALFTHDGQFCYSLCIGNVSHLSSGLGVCCSCNNNSNTTSSHSNKVVSCDSLAHFVGHSSTS